ncbi:MAG: carboxypeptidase-like regulatory domain-containing protein, partial [Candidatus Nanohaloarchaea archaeon]|nr:carboxypeptidase-like regulatory domain-containing protein [Candidatus Nanohaloarchaea archaeon]
MRTQKLITLLALITLITGLAAASGELKIIAKNENGDRIDDVNVTIQSSNTRKSKNTSSSGVARFVNLQAGDYTVNMTHRLYLSREVTVSVEDNTQTTKTVILERKQLEGTLKVHVKDFRGNNLGGAEVRVQSQSQGVNRQKETNSNGIASFTLRVGTYDVYINHPAHRASHVTVDVRAGKTIEKQVQLVESDGETSRDNLEITQIIVPSRIKKGGDVSVSFKVRNLGNTRMKSITASITAFRQTKTTENFAIEAGSSRWLVMNLSVPMDASGEERIQVSVENPDDRDVEFITTTVSDLAAYMDLKPSTAKNGQPVLVTGRIIHTNMVEGASGISANLYLGGSFVTGITTDETGRYSTYVYPEAPGSYTITLRNSYFSVSRSLQVRPALDSLTLDAPEQVNRTAVHDICGRIEASSPLNVNVLLRVDG